MVQDHSMTFLVREVFSTGAALNKQFTDQNEEQYQGAVRALIQNAKVTSFADALAAIDLIECCDTFNDADAEAAFRALASWLRADAYVASISHHGTGG